MAISAPAVFVHVGLPKTGTTHVQATLATNRPRLAEQGLLYPRVAGQRQHFLPVLDLLQMPFGGTDLADVAGLWDGLVAAVQDWPGPALISHELLSGAGSDVVARIVDDFSPREVHAVVTARDLSRLLPAVWQERAKNGVVETWAEFRTAVSAGPDGAEEAEPHPFWILHDIEKVLRAWREHVSDERIHVVTVPPADADEDLLFDRFASVVGVDRSGFVVPEIANASIGVLELAVLREINAVAVDQLDGPAYVKRVKRYLVPQLLSKRTGQVRVRLPDSDLGWVEDYTRRVSTELTGGGIDIVGSPADLAPTNVASADGRDIAVTGEVSQEAVARGLADVVLELLARRAEQVPERAAPADPRTPDQDTPPVVPVERSPVLVRVHRRVRSAAGRVRRRLTKARRGLRA